MILRVCASIILLLTLNLCAYSFENISSDFYSLLKRDTRFDFSRLKKNTATPAPYNVTVLDAVISHPGSPVICSGGSLVLTAVNPNPAAVISWLRNGVVIPGEAGSTYTVTQAGNYQLQLITNGNIVDVSPILTITVNALPTADFNSANTPGSGTEIQFTAIPGGTAPFTYLWDFGDGQTSNEANPVHDFYATGCSTQGFNTKLTVTDANGCSKTITKAVTVQQRPDVAVADVDIFNPFSNCHNSPTAANPNYTLTIRNTSANAGCTGNYTVDWGDGNVQTGINAASFPLSHTYTQLGAFNLKVTAAGSNGTESSKVYVVANQTNPAGGLGTLGATTGLCAPASVPFVISNWQNNSPGTIYILQYGDGTSETFQHPLNNTNDDQTIYHTYTKSSCPSSSFTATLIVKNACDETPYTAGNIQVRIKPSANFTVPAQTCDKQSICFSNTTEAGSTGANCSGATAYEWDFGDPASGANNTSDLANACHVFSAPGTYTVTLKATNPCGTSTKTQTVVVNPLPEMTSPNTAAVCSGRAVGLVFSSTLPSVYRWTATSNPNVTGESTTTRTSGTLTDNLVNQTGIAQTVVYTVTPVSAPQNCTGLSQTVSVTVYPVVPAPQVANVNYCLAENTVALTATALTGHTLNWYTSASGGTASTTAPTPSSASVGSNIYYVSQTNTVNACESARSAITVKVNAIPPAPAALAVTYCQGQATTALTATATSGNTMIWYEVATGGSPLSSAPVPNSTNVGTTTFYVSQKSNFDCESARTAVNVTINPTPSAPAIPSQPQNYCQGQPATPLLATADAGNTLKWYTVPTGGTASLSAPTPPTTVPGSRIYYVSQTAGNCESPRATISIQVNGIPAAPLVSSTVNYCLNETAVPLVATATEAGNTLNWYTTATGGTPIAPAPTPSTASVGNVEYYVSQTAANGCEGPRAMIRVVTSAPLTISNVLAVDPGTCNGSNGSITLEGLPTGIAFALSFKKDGAAINRVVTSSNTGQLRILNLTAGTYTDLQVVLGSCSAIHAGPVVLSDPLPPAVPVLGGNTLLCEGETLSLTASAEPGATYLWTGPGGFSSNLQNPGRPNASQLYSGIYTLTVTRNLCTSSSSINVTVQPRPVLVSTLSPPPICSNSSFGYTPAGNVPGITFSWSRASTTGIANAAANGTDAISEILVNTSGAPVEVTYVYTLKAGDCISTQNVKLMVYPAITNLLSSTGMTVCAGQQVVITGAVATGGTGLYQYTWESSADDVSWTTISNQNSKDLSITLPNTAYIRRVVSSGPCSATSAPLLITVQPGISNNTISASQQVCLGQPVVLLAGSTPTGADGTFFYQWQSSTDQITWFDLPGETGKDLQPAALTQTSYFRRRVSSALCSGVQQSSSNTVTITINPNARAEFAASSVQGCIPFNLSQVISVVPYPERNATYEWFANGQSIGTGANFPGHVITSEGDLVTIRLVTTSKFGCQGDVKEIAFSTVQSADALFTKDKAVSCGPATVTFSNQTVHGAGVKYEWDFGNGTSSSLQQPPAVVFAPHPLNRDTTYRIVLRAYTDCRESIYTDSVLVRPKPVAVFSPSVTIGCSPLKVTFSNQSRGAPATYTFDMGNGDKLIKSDKLAFDYTFTTAKADTFTVRLYAENECGIDSSFYDIIVLPNSVQPELVVNGGSTAGCAPFTVRFDNNSIGANSFLWDFGDGSSAASNRAPESKTHTFTRAGTYVVKLTASNGCSGAETTEIITVYDAPLAQFSTTKSEYCAKEPVTFINQPEPNHTYHWDFADGSTSNQANPVHSFALPGTYMVKLTVTRIIPNGSFCTSSVSFPVRIIPLPAVSISSNTTMINCAPFTFTGSAVSNGASAIEWNFGSSGTAGNIQNGFAANYTYDSPGTYTIVARSYNTAGCIDSTILLVKVTESPVAAFASSATAVCGTSGTLNFKNETLTPAATTVNYRWLVNDMEVSQSRDLNRTFNVPSGSPLPYLYQVKLIASSSNGCADTTEQTIRFNPLPEANYSTASSSGCAPFKLSLTNTSAYSDQFNWYLNNELVSTTAMPEIILPTPNSTYTLKLVTANVYGCVKDSISRTFTTLPSPVASFNLAESRSCNGKLDISIQNTSTGATSYTWNFGDGSAPKTGPAPAHTYGRPGVFTLLLTASNGTCIDTVSRRIEVAAPPQAGFIALNTTGCTSVAVQFRNISQNALAYLWDFGDGNYSTEKDPSHTYSYINSPFTVTLVSYGEFGCIDTLVMPDYIKVSAPPTALFEVSPDTVISIPDFSFGFTQKSLGNPVQFRWSFGDGKFSREENPSHTYAAIGKYRVQLIVTNQEGCTDTLIRTVEVEDVPGYLYVQNAFEPGNLDLKVKEFKPTGSGMTKYLIQIYNKWGQLIWWSDKLNEVGEPMEGWDGKVNGADLAQGVYIWNISATFINGTEWKGMKYNKGPLRKSGPVHLIR